MKKAIAISTIAVISLGIVGCSSVNHDSANPTTDVQYTWERIETPPSFTTLMFGCFGSTGIYMDQNDGNANEVPNDPLCPISNLFNPEIQKKYHFKIVTRTNGMGDGNTNQ